MSDWRRGIGEYNLKTTEEGERPMTLKTLEIAKCSLESEVLGNCAPWYALR